MAKTADRLGTEDVRWKLDGLYAGIDDPAIERDLAELEAALERFSASYRGKLRERLGDMISALQDIDSRADDPMCYLRFLESRDQTDQAVKTALQGMKERLSASAAKHLTFVDHELVELSQEDIDRQAADSETVQAHLPWIRRERLLKPHLLAENVEEALSMRAPFGHSAWADYFEECEADLRFPLDGESHTLTEMLHALLEETDAAKRAEIMRVIHEGFGGSFHKLSAQTLNMVIREKALDDRERGFAHPMAQRNLMSQIPDEVVEALHTAITETAAPLAQRYYRLKGALLGIPVLRWSDRNAPMPFADTSKVPFDAAFEIVLAAYRSFSPTLADLVEKQRSQGRIDAPVTKGRAGGAYNMSFTSRRLGGPVSWTFLNYLGSNRDVMTLAHELGHGVHGLLAGEAQGPLMQHAPMAYAETASVFGEMTTFNHLRARLAASGDRMALMALLMGKMDDMLNTAVRQIGFSNFERSMHGAGRRLSAPELDELWLQSVYALYGKPGEVFTYEHTERLWAYISHFHRPFYVYAYAFGELLTQSLYARREQLGDRFEPLYLDMLRSGSTRDAVELMAPFGLDPRDPAFWRGGIEVSIGKMLAEAEALADELGLRKI